VDDDKVVGYIVRTVVVAVTWPISLPLIGIFKIGQKFGRKEV
jgi:Na+-transporting methylmalonyl-CoA/oxaloacetate decarboxylase beta subunit